MVRSFLCEDKRGSLFLYGGERWTANNDRWALASFFGEEQQSLLCLRDEACDILKEGRVNIDVAPKTTADHIVTGDGWTGEIRTWRYFLITEPIGLSGYSNGLALAEQSEHERCKAWSWLILHRFDHPCALLSFDEYSVLSYLEKGGVPVMNGCRA